MNSTKSLLLLALVGYTVVSGAVVRKNLAQADVSQGSSTLVSTASAVAAETMSGTQTIADISCSNEANMQETSAEVGTASAVGCEAAKRLYLFGGAFDYFDTIVTSETGTGASLASSTGVATAVATSSLESGSSGALPTGVCVNACTGASYPVSAI